MLLAKKCSTLMASSVHHIPLFTSEFINKLIGCTYPVVFKIYLSYYMSWFDYSLLKRLIEFSSNKEASEWLNWFVSLIDYRKPVRSCGIPEVSQLIIPMDNSQHSLLAAMHIKSIDELTLQDVLDTKGSIMSILEISDYAIQLSAIHKGSSCMYWLIPSTIRPLIVDKLKQNQLKLFNKEYVFVKLLDMLCIQQSNFNFIHINLDDAKEV